MNTILMLTKIFLLFGIDDFFDNMAEWIITKGIEAFNACAKAMTDVLLVQTTSASSGTPKNATELFSWAWGQVVGGNVFSQLALIGGTLVITFFLVGYFRESIDIKKISNIEDNINLWLRLIIAVACVSGVSSFFPVMISGSVQLCQKVFNTNTPGIQNPEATATQIVETADITLGMIIFAIIFFIVLVAAGVGLLTIGLSRMFKLVVYACLGPVMLSTIAGGNGINRSASIWVRDFIACAFSNVVILLALFVGTKLIGMPLFSDSDTGIMRGIAMIVETIAMLGFVKTADSLLYKLLGSSA